MQEVEPGSKQWSYATFRLGLLLANPNVKITSLTRNSLPSPPFLNMLLTEGAIDITHLPQTIVSNIKSNTHTPLHVHSGSLHTATIVNTPTTVNTVPIIHNNPPLNNNPCHRILLLKIALNHILPIHRQPALKPQQYILDEYDTAYISSTQLSPFTHQYVIKQPNHYSWQYDIEYTLDGGATLWDNAHDCDHCTNRRAVWYCIEEREHYCVECFGEMHRSQKKRDHRKEPIDPFNTAGNCLVHQLTHQYFCFGCNILKCTMCAKGHTTQQHQLFELRALKEMCQEKDIMLLEEGKNKINKKIKEIQSKINLIRSHYQLRFKEIQRNFNDTVKKLEEQTNLELNKAIGIHCELKRKFDQQIWLKKYLQYVNRKLNADDNIKLREGLITFVDNITAQEYFQQIQKNIQEIMIFK